MEHILDHGCDINSQENRGTTVFWWACYKNYFEMAKMLLNRKSDILLGNESGQSPLHIAAICGHTDIVDLLISKGDDIDIDACSEMGAGRPPLALACATGRIDVVNYLLEKKADIDAVSGDGYTALMVASTYGHLPCVKTLIQHGADPKTLHIDGPPKHTFC